MRKLLFDLSPEINPSHSYNEKKKEEEEEQQPHVLLWYSSSR